MNRAKFLAIPFAVAFALTGCGFDPNTPSDNTPREPKKIFKKAIDERKCEKYKNRKCVKWDDKDWIFITSDGAHWDVDESDYNRYNVGDYWPR